MARVGEAEPEMERPEVTLWFKHGDRDFKIPVDWWKKAAMQAFEATQAAFSAQTDCHLPVVNILIDDVAPCWRECSHGPFNDDKEIGMTAEERVGSILQAFRDDVALPPIEVVRSGAATAYPFELHHGVHRFYCAVAAGFSAVPAIDVTDELAKIDPAGGATVPAARGGRSRVADDHTEDVVAHRDYYGSYHHHKEQMAFAAAALYLGAAVAVVSAEHPLWDVVRPEWLVYVVYAALVLSTLLGFAFVGWQLQMRADAERIVEICSAILADRLEVEGTPTETQRHRLAGILRDPTRLGFDSPKWTVFFTVGAMFVWTLAVLLRATCG